MIDTIAAVLAQARTEAGGNRVRTGHLLAALTLEPGVAPLLDAFDVTPVVVGAVVTTPGTAVAELNAGRSGPLSPAAAAVQRSADPRAMLAALLDQRGCEAVAVLRACGVPLDELRAAVRDGEPPRRPDPLDPALRPARDALLGRARYRGRGLRERLLGPLLWAGVNLAADPVTWTRLEADERARHPRTDDVLRALLVTHEVAAEYPHLARPAKHRYTGGARLLAAGVDRHRLAALTPDGGRDAVPAHRLLHPGPDRPADTGALLDLLLADPGNRAARLLSAAGFPRP